MQMIATIIISVILTIILNICFMYVTARFLEKWINDFFYQNDKQTKEFMLDIKELVHKKFDQKE